ncbi:MAG: UDP-N-acetylmuramoyl-tripeptide--D-alanyl-D-alanine ligase, partial [Saprospiraceae bacterium]|nr:UDP-N-acetylmuramoyl-tripeptide--D-alanyl-D-alanine ligase [Saprospiraceae bacterium]
DEPDLKNRTSCLYVPNTLTCLHRLAYWHRKHFDIPVIGITGSNGKTTTKELVAKVLAQAFRVHATKGNLNNHIGVPLTILAMPKDTEIAIIEMGANHQGEIRMLSHIADPWLGCITNIGKAHLEGFGDVEVIRKTKFELLDHLLQRGGVFFHNRDEPSLQNLPRYPGVENIEFGNSVKFGGKWKIKSVQSIPTIQMVFQHESTLLPLSSQLYGSFNVQNIKAALAIGAHFGVHLEKIIEGIAGYVPSNNRSEILERSGNTYYLDAYNANPTSMKEGIDFFSDLKKSGKILILGDMLELGSEASQEHAAILKKVNQHRKDFELVILIGNEFDKALKDQGLQEIDHFSNAKIAGQWLNRQKFKGKHIFVKGSRGIQLEDLLTASNE